MSSVLVLSRISLRQERPRERPGMTLNLDPGSRYCATCFRISNFRLKALEKSKSGRKSQSGNVDLGCPVRMHTFSIVFQPTKKEAHEQTRAIFARTSTSR